MATNSTDSQLRGITWDHPRGYQPLAASAEVYAADPAAWRSTGIGARSRILAMRPLDALADDVRPADRGSSACRHGGGVGLPAAARYVSRSRLCWIRSPQQSAGPSHASYTYAGHQWALAVDAAMQASAYRPICSIGPLPSAWESVLALAERPAAGGPLDGDPARADGLHLLVFDAVRQPGRSAGAGWSVGRQRTRAGPRWNGWSKRRG